MHHKIIIDIYNFIFNIFFLFIFVVEFSKCISSWHFIFQIIWRNFLFFFIAIHVFYYVSSFPWSVCGNFPEKGLHSFPGSRRQRTRDEIIIISDSSWTPSVSFFFSCPEVLSSFSCHYEAPGKQIVQVTAQLTMPFVRWWWWQRGYCESPTKWDSEMRWGQAFPYHHDVETRESLESNPFGPLSDLPRADRCVLVFFLSFFVWC